MSRIAVTAVLDVLAGFGPTPAPAQHEVPGFPLAQHRPQGAQERMRRRFPNLCASAISSVCACWTTTT
jgi:hypothetical protein